MPWLGSNMKGEDRRMDGHNSHCILAREYRITTPDELRSIIAMIRASLANKVIVEDDYWPAGQLRIGQPSFSSLPFDGPWPDYCEYYFRCIRCGSLFRFLVETYHGAGGKWEPWHPS